MDADVIEVPVLIIGAGPSGATTALLLGQYGIKSMAVSKHRSTANTPRAHIFNQRAMEVLRHAGLEKRLAAVASPASEMQHTSWLDSLAGREFGRLWAWGNEPSAKGDYEMASPCTMSDLPQSELEPILVDEARRRGADIRFSAEFVALVAEQDADGWIVTRLRDVITRKDYRVRSRYLVGADGARSAIVEALGIRVHGRQINHAFNAHIKADLTRFMAHRPGSLNWILNTDAPSEWAAVGNFRMVRPWTEFVVSMHPANKNLGERFNPSAASVMGRLHQMIGDDSVPIEILSTFMWTINDQVAETWQKGRVLCIGDAVHRHPPINGLGSNTCIGDAFNLAWKLAYVLRGWASPDLLDTLTTERKPVGDAVVRRANAGMEDQRRIWALLGLDAVSRQETIRLLETDGEDGAKMRAALREALAATSFEVQALGIQMNQVYEPAMTTTTAAAAVVVENGDSPPDLTIRSSSSSSTSDPVKHLWRSTFPGHHLPHVWLAVDSQSPRVSILDLCEPGAFTLFTGIGGDPWRQATRSLSLVDLSARPPHDDDCGGGEDGDQPLQPMPKLKAYRIGRFKCDYIDCYDDWQRVCGVQEDGAILVRPDHFVAWRCARLTSDPRKSIIRVLGKILGHHSPVISTPSTDISSNKN